MRDQLAVRADVSHDTVAPLGEFAQAELRSRHAAGSASFPRRQAGKRHRNRTDRHDRNGLRGYISACIPVVVTKPIKHFFAFLLPTERGDVEEVVSI